nr:hypothetical protein [Tanacetum cinerariifolium]
MASSAVSGDYHAVFRRRLRRSCGSTMLTAVHGSEKHQKSLC